MSWLIKSDASGNRRASLPPVSLHPKLMSVFGTWRTSQCAQPMIDEARADARQHIPHHYRACSHASGMS
jgi:hypothetical protein